ncbi:MAG: DUF6155 family protein [Firmicutes bacterium]|nr:DUF6155 family protein [Bacillota bacterium]
MANFSVTALKTYLSEKNEKELINEIAELVKLFPEVKSYYSTKLSPEDAITVMEKYRKIITDQFFPDRGHGKLRLSISTKALNDFMKISKNPVHVADLMLSYLENCIKFIDEYGDGPESLYTRIETLYKKAIDYTEKNNITEVFKDRISVIPDTCRNFGYGIYDVISDTYIGYFKIKPKAARRW